MSMSVFIRIPEYFFALREDLKDHPEFLPTKAHDTDTAWDVCCAEPNGILINSFEYKKIRLGFRAFCPEGWWYELKPRSSTFAKKELHCLYGTIDETYENELVLAVQYIPELSSHFDGNGYYKSNSDEHMFLEFGERIGQIIPVHRQKAKMTLVDNKTLDEMYKNRGGKRGTGGFGSTG